MATSAAWPMRILGRAPWAAPAVVLLILGALVLPLPPIILDLLFGFSISLSLVILLAAIVASRPLDFSVFPTVLLMATLLRLALNVAATRLILLHGQEGAHAAGRMIESFGNFVVGGNYAVGLIVFIILVIINFAVITRGAARVSEVSARFILDAMPGKQMAIDADLNSGLITAEEARKRRLEIREEADFYGSMDGASKFVRGDAIAGILILLVNILGGLVVGVAQHGMPLAEAASRYTLLTIGDGLVAQIPALLLSVASGLLVTRSSSAQDLGEQVFSQVFSSPKTLSMAASVLFLLGALPGMATIPFWTLAAILGGLAFFRAKRTPAPAPAAAPVAASAEEIGWEDVTPVDPLALEVGYRLIPLVEGEKGPLLARIRAVRKKLTQDLGFLIPAVHVLDNLSIDPNTYRILIKGVVVGEGKIYPERELAINPGNVLGEIAGIETKDPAYGMEAVWIEPALAEHAKSLGYTVVDPATVAATQLSEAIQAHAHELLGHEEAQALLDKLSKTSPKLVENLVPKTLPLVTVVKVLQNLLIEKVPVSDFRTIIEALAEGAVKTQDLDALTAHVRQQLCRFISQRFFGSATEISVLTLDPRLEQIVMQSLAAQSESLEPSMAQRLEKSLREAKLQADAKGQRVALLVPPPLRRFLARFCLSRHIDLPVLAYNELPDDKKVRVAASVSG